MTRSLAIYFSDFFKVDPKDIAGHGAFNVSLLSDLPLFIDPFLLFNSTRSEYQQLHADILRYMAFLRDKAEDATPSTGTLKSWFVFKEVKQTWLGFSRIGNSGSGLGMGFAKSLVRNMNVFFDVTVARAKHLEKLCLIEDGVGRDNISDFTTNLIKDYLIGFTQDFAKRHISPSLRKKVPVARARFNYDTETWETVEAELPYVRGDFVLLSPVDILTKDETWISRRDLVDGFPAVVAAISNDQLRAQLNNYFAKSLPPREKKPPTKKEIRAAVAATIREYPQVLDYYVKQKEDTGDKAEEASAKKVAQVEATFVQHVLRIVEALEQHTTFYAKDSTDDERLTALLAFVQSKGGGSALSDPDGLPFRLEPTLELVLKLIWQAAPDDDPEPVRTFPLQCKLASNARFAAAIETRPPSSLATIVVAYNKHEVRRAKQIIDGMKLGNNARILVVEPG